MSVLLSWKTSGNEFDICVEHEEEIMDIGRGDLGPLWILKFDIFLLRFQ